MAKKRSLWRLRFWRGVGVGTAVFFFAALLISPTLQALILAWSVTGNLPSAEYGYAIAAAGDVNGDGRADLIVGSPKYESDIYTGGAAFVYHGYNGGLSDQPNWTGGSDLKGARYGFAAASAGDINHDGYDDIIIGAYRYNNGQSEEGRVYLYLGSADGLHPEPAWQFESDQKEAHLGYAVASAGDVNNDGFDDVLVGARWYQETLVSEGAAFLFFGSADGLSDTPDWTAVGGQAGAAFGTAVAAAGDTNHDGYDDILIGAPFFDNTLENAGAAYLFLGSETGPGNGAAWQATGSQAGDLFGSALAAGDFNDDNASDLLVGGPHSSDDVDDEGGVFLYLGSSSGLMSSTAVWSTFGGQAGALFGTAVAVGDVNGDALADILVGAPNCTQDQSNEGCVFLYLGMPGSVSATTSWTSQGNKADTAYGISTAVIGSVNGDGYDEIAVGAPQYRFDRDLVGRAFVYYGAEQLIEQVYVYLPVAVQTD